MHEHLELAAGLLVYRPDFGERKLARQRHAIGPEALREPHAFGIGDAHLRAGVQFHIRRNLAQQSQNPEILDDHRVRARFDNRRAGARRLVQFVLEDQRIESDVIRARRADAACASPPAVPPA